MNLSNPGNRGFILNISSLQRKDVGRVSISKGVCRVKNVFSELSPQS